MSVKLMRARQTQSAQPAEQFFTASAGHKIDIVDYGIVSSAFAPILPFPPRPLVKAFSLPHPLRHRHRRPGKFTPSTPSPMCAP
ncbi:hypothetical protein IAT38_003202 [Cryptococcus sp. DSM 104549]